MVPGFEGQCLSPTFTGKCWPPRGLQLSHSEVNLTNPLYAGNEAHKFEEIYLLNPGETLLDVKNKKSSGPMKRLISSIIKKNEKRFTRWLIGCKMNRRALYGYTRWWKQLCCLFPTMPQCKKVQTTLISMSCEGVSVQVWVHEMGMSCEGVSVQVWVHEMGKGWKGARQMCWHEMGVRVQDGPESIRQ